MSDAVDMKIEIANSSSLFLSFSTQEIGVVEDEGDPSRISAQFNEGWRESCLLN